MFRLIFMIAIACVLWPIDENNERLGVKGIEISSADLVSAGTAIFADVGSFCDRNVETCLTGGKIIKSVVTEVQSQISPNPQSQVQTVD